MVELGESWKKLRRGDDPIGKPAVSTNLDRDLSDNGPQPGSIQALVGAPTHIQYKTAWSGLSERRCT